MSNDTFPPNTTMIINNIMTVLCINKVSPDTARVILQTCLNKVNTQRNLR
mgnify:CR=1 FL=1